MNKLINKISLSLAKIYSPQKYEELQIKIEVDDLLERREIVEVLGIVDAGYKLTEPQIEKKKEIYMDASYRFPHGYKPTPEELVDSLVIENYKREFVQACASTSCHTGNFEERVNAHRESSHPMQIRYNALTNADNSEFINALFHKLYTIEPRDAGIIFNTWREKFEQYVEIDNIKDLSKKLNKKDKWAGLMVEKSLNQANTTRIKAQKLYGTKAPLPDNLGSEITEKVKSIESQIQKSLQGSVAEEEKARLILILSKTLPELLGQYSELSPEFRYQSSDNQKCAHTLVLKNLDLIEKSAATLTDKINQKRLDNLKKTMSINERSFNV